jgi:hypothetical protein
MDVASRRTRRIQIKAQAWLNQGSTPSKSPDALGFRLLFKFAIWFKGQNFYQPINYHADISKSISADGRRSHPASVESVRSYGDMTIKEFLTFVLTSGIVYFVPNKKLVEA